MLQIQTPSGRWGALADRVQAFLRSDVIALRCDGQAVRGFRSPDSPALWIRDHSDILRGGVFVEADVWSAVEAFARTQSKNGRVFDYVMAQPTSTMRENWETWMRVPVEADVEYRFVNAAYLAWQASGDADRIARLLPSLDAALTYTRTHPERWDETTGLVKRGFTMDTWDFDYTAGRYPWLNFQINEHTFWGIAHGDNSGFYQAAKRLARLYHWGCEAGWPGHGDGWRDRADYWNAEADGVQERANALLWNGRFYTHFHHLVPCPVPEVVDEARQLSLSNPMAVNRGMAKPGMAVALVDEYAARGREGQAFAPWYSIDPPFPVGFFGDDKLVVGAYINGGIFPLVGGELALAAFNNGREAYGVETLTTYADMVERTGETYLWYFHDGTPSSVDTSTSPEAMPTDGWGSSAMLMSLVEGLAGVRDQSHSFSEVSLAPRW
ncbi:MAG TPA: hypothetical protein VD948_04475, partial [Rhodothermales bacterium]|nr:hypothetical protein [Rhodothermales bacterium]